jgi:hypothetical protein
MSQRMVLAIVVLVLACSIPGIAGAQGRTNINGSVVVPARPTAPAPVLAVIAYQSGREVGRSETSLPSGSSLTYPFNFFVDATGSFEIKAYIISDGDERRIRFQSHALGQNVRGAPYTPGMTISLTAAGGNERLPPGSAGTVLILVGVLAAILAGAIAVWRRRRPQVRVPRFA